MKWKHYRRKLFKGDKKYFESLNSKTKSKRILKNIILFLPPIFEVLMLFLFCYSFFKHRVTVAHARRNIPSLSQSKHTWIWTAKDEMERLKYEFTKTLLKQEADALEN